MSVVIKQSLLGEYRISGSHNLLEGFKEFQL